MATDDASRRYPTRPIVGVGAVVLTGDGRVVLVKRGHDPLAGQWSLPGGMLELGETLEAGVAREILEETGLIVDVGPRQGRLEARTDVEDVVLADPDALEPYRLTERARAVIAQARAIAGRDR